MNEIRKDLVLREQAVDTLMFASYTDENNFVNIHFEIGKKKVLVIKTSNFDCDECLDMVMLEVLEGHWANSLPVEFWYEGEYKHSSIVYKDWYRKLRNAIRFRELGSEMKMLSSNKKGKPFLFIFDASNRQISHVFFPITGKKGAVAEYFSIIGKKFFNN